VFHKNKPINRSRPFPGSFLRCDQPWLQRQPPLQRERLRVARLWLTRTRRVAGCVRIPGHIVRAASSTDLDSTRSFSVWGMRATSAEHAGKKIGEAKPRQAGRGNLCTPPGCPRSVTPPITKRSGARPRSRAGPACLRVLAVVPMDRSMRLRAVRREFLI